MIKKTSIPRLFVFCLLGTGQFFKLRSRKLINLIEILKGPHALRYGGAFGGTINFVPASLRFSDQPTNYGRLSGGYDSSAIKANFQRGSFGGDLGLKLSNNQELRLSVIRNIARDTDFPALSMDLRSDDTWMFNASHELTIYSRPICKISFHHPSIPSLHPGLL